MTSSAETASEALPSFWGPDGAAGPRVAGVKDLLRQSSWTQRVLLVLAIVVPFGLAGLFAVHQRAEIISDAHESAKRSAVALEQHAANVLDTHSLILRQLHFLTQGRTWDQIRNDELLRISLADFSRDLGQISAIGISDAEGNVITSSPRAATEPVSVANLDFFQAHKRRAPVGIFVSEAFAGAEAGQRHFALSIRRTLPSGEFAGVIFTAVPLDHFIGFWRGFTPSGGHLIPMVRPDGALIVRYPRTDSPQHLDPRGPFVSHLTRSPRGLYTAVSQVDGVERINAYSQVKNYPLFISFSVETGMVLQRWRTQVLVVTLMAAIVASLLAALWLAAVRNSFVQRQSAVRWEAAARALQNEIALRREAEESARLGARRASFGDQLIGIVSHDLRNPLNTIALTAAVMARRGALAAQDAQLVQRIQNAAQKAGDLIRDLLDFTQARLGRRIPVQLRRTNLHEVLQSVVAELDAAHPDRVACQLEAEEPWGELDPARLAQVVENLVLNALKYGVPGGTVRIATASDAASLMLQVHNDGRPIPPEKIPVLFEPLQRGADESQSNPDRSIGMGLYIVKHLVDAHGGTLSVESTAAQGTTFSVRLPRAP